MILYNTATWIMAILIVLMLIFVAAVLQHTALPGHQSANIPGRDYEGRVSDGLKSSPGLSAKEFK